MNTLLVNHCNKRYRPDPIKVTNKILSKIPAKFLVGLKEICFFDHSNNPVVRYIPGELGSESSKIEIYMEGFSKKGSYSIFHYNLIFLPLITDHIENYLQPVSIDDEILAVRPHKFNPRWMYLSWSTPILIPLHLFRLIYLKFGPFNRWFNKKRDQLIKEISKGT